MTFEKRLRELDAKATPGEWEPDHEGSIAGPTIDDDWDWVILPVPVDAQEERLEGEKLRHEENRKLICLLRNHAAQIAELVEAARAVDWNRQGIDGFDRLRKALAALDRGEG